jgi:hypothetical protein
MSVMGWASAAAWTHAEQLLTRGKATNQSLATGASYNTDVLVGGQDELVVNVEMTGAANGDLTVQVQPFEPDGVTLMPIAIAPMFATGPTFSGASVYYTGRFDVTMYQKVRISVKNNNAGTQTLKSLYWGFGGS